MYPFDGSRTVCALMIGHMDQWMTNSPRPFICDRNTKTSDSNSNSYRYRVFPHKNKKKTDTFNLIIREQNKMKKKKT